MPWQTPSLSQVRTNNRDYISAALRVPLIPNEYPRVLADANAGNAHLNLQYLDWLALQLLPDTAEQQFLDKWANIYLTNSDGSVGRKVSTYASGTASMVATVSGTILPAGTQFTTLNGSAQITYESIEATSVSTTPTSFAIRSLTAGAAGNLDPSTGLTITAAIPGIDAGSATIIALSGGADEESDDELRTRVLNRISRPPMSGDATDWEAWALSVPGVTRAWCSPNEMGAGTVTIRIMCDDLRATNDPMTSGLPTASDIAAVRSYLDTVRPVTVADYYVLAPIPEPVSFSITNLSKDSVATRTAIATSVERMIFNKARPARAQNGTTVAAQTIYAAWVSDAILGSSGVRSFDLGMTDHVPANNGSLCVLGSINYG